MKKSSDEPFSGKIFSKSSEQLAEKVVDIEECGRIGIKGMGPVTNFEFHHLAPVAVTSQQDTVVLYQVQTRFPLLMTRVNSVFRLMAKKMENFNRFVLVNLKWLDVQLFPIPKFYAHPIRHGFILMTLSTVKLPDTRF